MYNGTAQKSGLIGSLNDVFGRQRLGKRRAMEVGGYMAD